MSTERASLFAYSTSEGAGSAYNRFAALAGWEKLSCGCYAESDGDGGWRVAATSFLCGGHEQGDAVMPHDVAPLREDEERHS
jgi:hypothetical protein